MSLFPLPSAALATDRVLESEAGIPSEVTRLISARSGPDAEEAWTAFVATYSCTLLRVASAFSPGYDGALDRYAYMLDQLRRHDYRRLRRFVADGRGRFTTWLTVVARRLCLDHYRVQYGRFRRRPRQAGGNDVRTTRRRLTDLVGECDKVAWLVDSSATDPVDDLTTCERYNALKRAMAELAPGDQLLLRLRFEEGLGARQISVLLGLPTAFHVYRRVDALCGLLRARLVGSAPGNGPSGSPDNVRPVTKGRKRAAALPRVHDVQSA
jgi:RNA polymerase sigma factor (sigma-70 family)